MPTLSCYTYKKTASLTDTDSWKSSKNVLSTSLLHNDFRLMILFTELRGVAALAFAEQAVEVAQRVETTGPANLTHAIGGVNQSACSLS